MPWRIVSGPHDSGSAVDVAGWMWELENEEGRIKHVEVVVTGQATLPDATAHVEAARARDSKGRSAIQSVLGRDEPPRWIRFTSSGREEQA
jgi:hypothetical protein